MEYTISLAQLSTNNHHSISNVVADGIIESVRVRWFLQADGTRHEIPMDAFRVTFSSERSRIQQEPKQAQG